MILDVGSKVLVVHRRLFEKDRERFFVGSVDCCESGIALVSGHTWVQDQINGKFIRKKDVRTKVIPLTSQGLIIYALPPNVQINHLAFHHGEGAQLWLRDSDNHFVMDLSEMWHAT